MKSDLDEFVRKMRHTIACCDDCVFLAGEIGVAAEDIEYAADLLSGVLAPSERKAIEERAK